MHVAGRLGLKGWVKNLYDRSVEAVVEGDEQAVKELLRALEERFSGYIRQTDVDWAEATDEFKSFDVRF
jgi:acylphosphatase